MHFSEIDDIASLVRPERIITYDKRFDLGEFGINGYVIHTPGHSLGSSSIILNDQIALVGDLIVDFYTKPWSKKPKKVSTESVESIKKLLSLNCSLYIPAHKKNYYEHAELNNLFSRYLSGEAVYE